MPPVGDATDPPLFASAIRPPGGRPPDTASALGELVGRAARGPAPAPMAPESGGGTGSSPTRLSSPAPSRQETGTGATARRANRPAQPAPRHHLIPTVFQVLVATPGATAHNHFSNVIPVSCFRCYSTNALLSADYCRLRQQSGWCGVRGGSASTIIVLQRLSPVSAPACYHYRRRRPRRSPPPHRAGL